MIEVAGQQPQDWDRRLPEPGSAVVHPVGGGDGQRAGRPARPDYLCHETVAGGEDIAGIPRGVAAAGFVPGIGDAADVHRVPARKPRQGARERISQQVPPAVKGGIAGTGQSVHDPVAAVQHPPELLDPFLLVGGQVSPSRLQEVASVDGGKEGRRGSIGVVDPRLVRLRPGVQVKLMARPCGDEPAR